MKTFIKNLLSGCDEISSNRTLGIMSFIALLLIIGFGLYFNHIMVDKFEIAVEYMFYLVVVLFTLKSSEKITDIMANLPKKKSKNTSESEEI